MTNPKQTCVKLQWYCSPGYYRYTVFLGPDCDHLANCGTLTMLPDEARRFRMCVSYGIGRTDDGLGLNQSLSGMFESGWPEQDE